MAYLTSEYKYVARSSAMTAPNGANYYVIMQAKANYGSVATDMSVMMLIACTENSSFYNYKTSYYLKYYGKTYYTYSDKPDAAWDTTPITVNGITYKKWCLLDTFDSTWHDDAKDREVAIEFGFSFNDTTTDTYTPATGTTRTISSTVLLKGVVRDVEFNSISSSTKYLDSTITCKYASNGYNLYIRRYVYLNINDELVSIRVADLGQKLSGDSLSSTINLTAAELSKIYALVKDTTTAKIRVAFRAFNDSAYTDAAGSAKYKEITLTIPVSVKPTVSMNASPVSSLGWILSRGIYVANGVSNAKFTITGEAGEGASLSYTTITSPDGSVAKGSSFTFNFTDAGEYTFAATAVDSRGRTATTTKKISVLPYGVPSISKLQAERGTYGSKWTADGNGSDVRVTFKATLKLADEGNTYNATFKNDGTSITPAAGSTTGLASGAEQVVYFKNVDSEKSHRLALTVTDSIGSTMSSTITIPSKNVTIEYNSSGKGVAFGKPSEKNALECAWPMYLSDDLFLATKITCNNPFSLRNFNISSYWADNAIHDMLVRNNDGLTLGLGWSGSADDGTSYDTVLDVRPKLASFRGTVTAPRGRFTATNDASGTEQKDVPLRVGDAEGSHIDFDTNEIQVKEGPATPGPLYLNLDGGAVYAGDFKIPEIQRGSVTIKPTAANTPTSADVTFPKAFSGTPTVIVTPATSVPGTTVVGAGVNTVSATGCKIWTTRTNTTDTVINWIAVY